MIYILRNSPHNEDYMMAYAVDDAGLIKLAIDYVKEYFWYDGLPEPTAVIDWGKRIVTVTVLDTAGDVDYIKDFYLSILEQVQ
jgi:hypothetical protein